MTAAASSDRSGLELQGTADALIDEPWAIRVRGAGPDAEVVWRARLLDDDGRAWKSTASSAADLGLRWGPVKAAAAPPAAGLRSLRAVRIEVRAEAADGRAATRTFTRRLAAEGGKVRRWRDEPLATLHLPADPAPAAPVVLDATAGEDHAPVVAALLAARGLVVLDVAAPRRGEAAAALATAAARLADLPAAAGRAPVTLAVPDLPPGIPTHRDRTDAVARAAAWDALLTALGAHPRST